MGIIAMALACLPIIHLVVDMSGSTAPPPLPLIHFANSFAPFTESIAALIFAYIAVNKTRSHSVGQRRPDSFFAIAAIITSLTWCVTIIGILVTFLGDFPRHH